MSSNVTQVSQTGNKLTLTKAFTSETSSFFKNDVLLTSASLQLTINRCVMWIITLIVLRVKGNIKKYKQINDLTQKSSD